MGERLGKAGVQLPGGCPVPAEWLLHDESALGCQAHRRQSFDDILEHRWWYRQVKDWAVGRFEPLRQLLVGLRVAVVTHHHRQVVGQFGERGFVQGPVLAQDVSGVGAEPLVVPVGAGNADDRDAQPPGAGEFVDGGDEFFADQVTGCTEKDLRVCAGFHGSSTSDGINW